MVLIEMDQAENEKVKDTIRKIAQIAPILSPGISQAVPISNDIVETILSQNIDDVFFDQRFTLKRMQRGEKVRRGALLFGKYVAISQEDFLADRNVLDRATSSVAPVEIEKLRYDLHKDRLSKIYTYVPPTNATDSALSFRSENWGPRQISSEQTKKLFQGQQPESTTRSLSDSLILNNEIAKITK